MTVHEQNYQHLRQIIAADQRWSTVTPDDDQIWQLETSRGEPPGLALQTTYGLRAYGIRVFPRFSLNKVPVSDPRSFYAKPSLIFSAANFLELQYSPYASLDVDQKVWVPDSHTITAQITLTNSSSDLIQLWMEWIVQLNPLLSGAPMSAAQISVNTVLQGQTGSLFPVFLLTGGPRGDLSAFPSLGMEITLPPHAGRQFSWALAALGSTDSSFYAVRKATAYTLDNEQLKIQMLEKSESIGFDFSDATLDQRLVQSQQRAFQLLLPAYHGLEHPWYVGKRDPEHGSLPAESHGGYSPNWGIQKLTEIWALSRILLPLKPDLVKGMLQNLLDDQADDGTLYAQLNWNGKITSLPAAPLAAALAVDIYTSTKDVEWLAQNYAALLRSIKVWSQPQPGGDGSLIPTWQHLLQTGMVESLSEEQQLNLEALINTAEWPSLAALLLNECRALKKIAVLVNDTSDLDWLDQQIKSLDQTLQACWDAKLGIFAFRDLDGHFSARGKTLHTIKQDGADELDLKLENPVRLVIHAKMHGMDTQPFEFKIKGSSVLPVKGSRRHEKILTLTERDFHWHEQQGLFVTNEVYSTINLVALNGLKKGASLIVETPDHLTFSPDFMLPLWAGAASPKQAEALIRRGMKFLEEPDQKLPFHLKIMWLEALIKMDRKDLAAGYYRKWYLENGAGNLSSTLVGNGLEDLIPIQILLQLLGIERLSDEELILSGFNEFFSKVNVQYKRFKLDLESSQVRIENLNGENVIITEPGPHRIMLS